MIQVQIPKEIIKLKRQIIALESVLRVEEKEKDRIIHLAALERLRTDMKERGLIV